MHLKLSDYFSLSFVIEGVIYYISQQSICTSIKALLKEPETFDEVWKDLISVGFYLIVDTEEETVEVVASTTRNNLYRSLLPAGNYAGCTTYSMSHPKTGLTFERRVYQAARSLAVSLVKDLHKNSAIDDEDYNKMMNTIKATNHDYQHSRS